VVEIVVVGDIRREAGVDSGEGCSAGEGPMRNLREFSLWVRMV
jgi:hypothetical protein